MKVGYCQSHPEFGAVQRNLDEFAAQLELGEADCDLLVLPELAFSGYQFATMDEVLDVSERVPDGPTTQACVALARRHQMHLVVGLPEREGDRCYNSAIVVGPSGFLGCYRKTHLFFEETLFFSPGNSGFQVWDIGQARIGVMICFDWYYPEVARTLTLPRGGDRVSSVKFSPAPLSRRHGDALTGKSDLQHYGQPHRAGSQGRETAADVYREERGDCTEWHGVGTGARRGGSARGGRH